MWWSKIDSLQSPRRMQHKKRFRHTVICLGNGKKWLQSGPPTPTTPTKTPKQPLQPLRRNFSFFFFLHILLLYGSLRHLSSAIKQSSRQPKSRACKRRFSLKLKPVLKPSHSPCSSMSKSQTPERRPSQVVLELVSPEVPNQKNLDNRFRLEQHTVQLKKTLQFSDFVKLQLFRLFQNVSSNNLFLNLFANSCFSFQLVPN